MTAGRAWGLAAIALVGAMALVGAIVVGGRGQAPRPSDATAVRATATANDFGEQAGSPPGRRAARRSMHPERSPSREGRAPVPLEQRAPAVYTPDPQDDRALVGLGFRATTDADRARLRVPDRFGPGTIITSIHPDAPAVLSGLKVDDVIVRAGRASIETEADLEAAVGARPQTVLTVARGGQLFRVVLHKPYVPGAGGR